MLNEIWKHPILWISIVSGLSVIGSYFLRSQENTAAKCLRWASVLNAFIASIGLALYLFTPPKVINLWITKGLGLSIQQDSLSLILTTMISLLGMAILIFSVNYLEGEKRRLTFLRGILMTGLSAILLVNAGNIVLLFLAWVATSYGLIRLLVFYKDKLRTHVPARKKMIMARISDLFLLLAGWQLYTQFGTGQISEIQTGLINGTFSTANVQWAAIFIGIAALCKSAQLPFHGWLVEVMETPTPVSALLHAGILNAGPFLALRFSFLFNASESASLMLVIIGGLTAAYASTVLLTQSAIKTILGYSSAAHMGFMLFLCGIGAYSAAFLHLVGHSFYKAFAFLESGSAVQEISKTGSIVKQRETSSRLITLISLGVATTIYGVTAKSLGLSLTDYRYALVGSIVILGNGLLIASGLRAQQWLNRLMLLSLSAFGVTLLFFKLEQWMHAINVSVFKQVTPLSPFILVAYMLLFLGYTLLIWLQSSGTTIKPKTIGYSFYIHLRNGFYLNTYLNKWIGSYKLLYKKETY